MNAMKSDDLVSSILSAGEFLKSKPCLCFESKDSICNIIEKMRENQLYAVPIVENGKFAGLLTSHDILIRAATWRSKQAPSMEYLTKAFNSMKASDVMIRNPVTVGKDTPLDEVMHIMAYNGFRHLPIMDGDQPVGILHIGDVARYMAEKSRKDIEEKDAILSYVMNNENYGCVPQD